MRLLSQKHLDKIETTNEFLKDNICKSILEFTKEYYAKNPIVSIFEKILKNDFDQNTIDYLKEKLGNMNRFRDHRTAEEYACDLLLGWIVEDTAIYLFEKLGYTSEIISKDRKREFLKRPSSKIDIVVHLKNEKDVLIELVADNTGFWGENKIIHLREQKYDKIYNQNGVLLGLDFQNSEFFIQKIVNMKVNKKIDRHFLYGGKPATELSLEDIKFISFNSMKQELNVFFKSFQ